MTEFLDFIHHSIHPNIWQIKFDKVKYLPLPKSYNTDLDSYVLFIISSLKAIKKIFGHYRIFVLDAL